jgi:hypothetical protein
MLSLTWGRVVKGRFIPNKPIHKAGAALLVVAETKKTRNVKKVDAKGKPTIRVV